jgi:hypothetical protein
MTDLPIAETPDELTAAWLTDALTAAGRLTDAVVVDVTAKPLGTGQMCDSVRVTLGYDKETDAPAHLIAKLPAADPTSRMTALALRSYEKEVRFYQELAPALPMRTPAVYHADIDTETAAFTLLLEDMAPAEQGDQLAGCSVEVAEVAVAELVRLHAPRWDDDGLFELAWLYQDPELSKGMTLAMLPVLWDGFRERYAAQLEAHVHEAGDALFAGLEAFITPPADGRTIVHGDYRLDNLLFDPTPGGTPIAVVDWQTCAVGTALSDVAYFIGAGLTAEDRRAAEDGLVRTYFDDLLAAGVSGYAWDRCWDDYRKGTFAGLLMAVGASMMVERTDRGDQMFMAMASRHARHALDLEAPDLLR